jgi:hypothetical protein
MDALAFIRIVGIVRNVRMKIAVARMEDIAHMYTMLRRDGGDLRKNVSESSARNNCILNHEMRSHSPHRAERFLATLP